MDIPAEQFFSRQCDPESIKHLKPGRCIAVMADPGELFYHAEGQPLKIRSVCTPFVIVEIAASSGRTIWLDLRDVEICLVAEEYFNAVDENQTNRLLWMRDQGMLRPGPGQPAPQSDDGEHLSEPQTGEQQPVGNLVVTDTGIVPASACANCGDPFHVVSPQEWDARQSGMPPPQFICRRCDAILYVPISQPG